MNRFLTVKVLIILLFVNTYSKNIKAQSAGDIAFIVYNGDGSNSVGIGDHFGFVMLVDFPANTPIWFTYNTWDGDSFTNLNDREIRWVHAEIVPAGTVIIISGIIGELSTI